MIPAAGIEAKSNQIITVACIPLLFWGFTRINSDTMQALFFLFIILLAFTSYILAGLEARKNVTRNRASIYPVLWTGAAGLYLAAIAWNRFFRREILEGSYTGDIFRRVYWNFWAPIYGRPDPVSAPDLLIIAALSLSLYGLVKIHENSPPKPGHAKPLAFLAIFNLILIAAFALSQGEARLLEYIYDYKSFGTPDDLMLFGNLHDIWAKWTALMPGLHGRNPHYPPGNLFILKIEQVYDIPGLLRFLVILAVLLCVPLLYALGKRLGFNHNTALLVTALFTTSASPTIFPTTSTAPLTIFLALVSWLGWFTAIKDNALKGAFLCGASLALYSVFSFSVFIVGLSLVMIGLIQACLDRQRLPVLVKTSLVTGMVFVACLSLLYLATGFNAWLCLVQSIRQNSGLMTADPFDTTARYLLRSSGNILAYAIYTGVVLSSLAMVGCVKVTKAPPDAGIFIAGSLITLFAAGFSGLFFMETERIWMFFTPALAIAAGWGILCFSDPDHRPDIARVLVMTNFLCTAVEEICFRQYW